MFTKVAMQKILKRSFVAFLLIAMYSCQKELNCFDCSQTPVANAGPDRKIVLPEDSVLLQGDASYSLNNKIIFWKWTSISGPSSFSIINATSANTIVNNLIGGIYQFKLTVTDENGASASDTINIVVDNPTVNQPPVANAGADQTITLPTSEVLLSGNLSVDPDNNITQYNWLKISGPSLYNLASSTSIQTRVTNLIEGVYQFELTVTDAGSLFSKDTVQITISPAAVATCELSARPIINGVVDEIGTLSEPRIPAVGAAGNKIVFAGGWNGVFCQIYYYKSSAVVDVYDKISRVWTTAQLSNERGDISVATLGNKIFFAGGVNWENYQSPQWSGNYDNVDIYDVATNTWSVAHLSKARQGICATVVGSKVIFAGGTYFTKISAFNNPVSNVSDVVDIYDATTNSWSVAKLSVARTGISAVVTGNNVYFAGGYNSAGIQDVDVADVYNATNNTWQPSTLPAHLAYKQSHQVENFVTWSKENRVKIMNLNTGSTADSCVSGLVFKAPVKRNNDIAFATGSNSNEVLTRFDVYHTNSNSWSVLNLNQNVPGSVNSSIISANNTVYLGGGSLNKGGCNITFYDKVYTLGW